MIGDIIISLVMVGVICGAIMYLYGWEKGYDDSRRFVYATLDMLSDEGILCVVREMAKRFREEGAENEDI